MWVDCDAVICSEGFVVDENDNCVFGSCGGLLTDVNGNCYCPSFMETVNGDCIFKCIEGYTRNEAGNCTLIEDCDTEDELISHVEAELEALWKNSNASHTSSPMGDRVERGGWIVSGTDGYSFVPFPSAWVMTPCGIDGTINDGDIPDNLVGIIHTHPFYVGEDTRGVCGFGRK